MIETDRRVIEDYLPIKAISAEASREKSVRKGHISTVHLWWARRPLVACRAAVYGALVPTSRFGSGAAGQSGTTGARAGAAAFLERLCKYAASPQVLTEAEQHILEAHAARLSGQLAQPVTVEDIAESRAPRPKVLDLFAGGGSIPFEALRLGCDAFALDLNPVAHIIELATLVFPQKYGAPNTSQKGCGAGATWAGLAKEVRYWGDWLQARVRGEIGDLYRSVLDSRSSQIRQALGRSQLEMSGEGFQRIGQQEFSTDRPTGNLKPVAYLWTRTVPCKNPSCGATVPLVRQTWLRRKAGRYLALRMVAPSGGKRVRFELAEANSENGLGFDPASFSKAGNAICPFCGTVADADYVQALGRDRRVAAQLMAVVCGRDGSKGKTYVSAAAVPDDYFPDDFEIARRIESLSRMIGLSVPTEPINPLRPSPNARGLSAVTRHGLTTFGDLFTRRQTLSLMQFAYGVQRAEREMLDRGYASEHARAICVSLGLCIDKMADYANTISRWGNDDEGVTNAFSRQALPMVWDFAEASPFSGVTGSIQWAVDYLAAFYEVASQLTTPAVVVRGTATELPWPAGHFDAVVTDPPYYDNVPYADISDFFYIWLKRTVGQLYPEHFAADLTPKRSEATALSSRYGGDMGRARESYETAMLRSFKEAHRVLKSGAPMVVVYAHKTTLGWATLVDALRMAEFCIVEAWPLATESTGRLLAHEGAALASSIFLVARKRGEAATGSYESQVRPELEDIVRERVQVLWDMGVSGADLVIAAIGAGLRAFTRFGTVEYSNGEEVPAGRFLAEVEGVVLDTLLEKIFGVSRAGVSAVDGPSRFYVLWRFTYKVAEIDSGEAIVFTYGQPVELEGPQGLSTGARALVQKKQTKYRVLDFTERGRNDKLGLPDRLGQPAPIIDVLHRILWLIEHESGTLPRFLDEARPDPERLRLLAQALAGAGLKGKSEEDARGLISTTGPEQAALAKLTANWRSLIEQQLPTAYGPLFATAD